MPIYGALTRAELFVVPAAVVQPDAGLVAVAGQPRGVHRVVGQHALDHAAAVAAPAAQVGAGAQVRVGVNADSAAVDAIDAAAVGGGEGRPEERQEVEEAP